MFTLATKVKFVVVQVFNCFMKKIEFCFQEIEEVIDDYFLSLVQQKKIFVFYGPLGVGKTTLIRQILRSCGVEEKVSSPTFSYLKTYFVSGRKPFCHFDLYRLSRLQDFLDLGFDEYLNRDFCCFVEWPEIIYDLLEKDAIKDFVLHVGIEYVDRGESLRRLVFF